MAKCIGIKSGLIGMPIDLGLITTPAVAVECFRIVRGAVRCRILRAKHVTHSRIVRAKRIMRARRVMRSRSVMFSGVFKRSMPRLMLKFGVIVCTRPIACTHYITKSGENIFTPKTLFSELKLIFILACGKIASTFSEINIMSDILQPLNTSGGSRDDPDILTISHKEELLLLALYQKELYGLQIQQAIKESSGGLRQFRIGSLYPMLHSLESKGYVQSRWGDEQHHERGGARRRYYQLTETGSAAVEFIQAFHQNLINWGFGKA
jgi:PadR family transcriptional regulator, regulatory protein PadR